NVDLNDNLFTPGDTVSYFYSASSTDATNYFSTEYGTTTDINAIAANPMEFTILPAGGYNRGGQWLYVDGADGTGTQPYWDGAFMQVGISHSIDRYDVRGASSPGGNTLASRVVNVAAQLAAAYRIILWDSGSLSTTLGDGTGAPTKADDYELFNQFLSSIPTLGGVFLCGDDAPQNLYASAGTGAVNFRGNYIPFTLISSNHRLAPTSFSISPTIVPWPGRIFSDSFVIFGGCPELNDFDVIGASGTSQVQMSYNTASSPNGAVVSNRVGSLAGVVLAGFSLANIRDNELDGISDKAKYLRDILSYFGNICGFCIGAGPLDPVNSLAQNYPNPFNPATTISFSLRVRSTVSLKIYDVTGALVRELAHDARAAGPHTVTWDGRDDKGRAVGSGVYFYKLVAGEFTSTKKMVLLK
ncbi:MAG TPA: FlgD immunoglobulin-like domain containing protein, partial [Candidatus Krumholzibacteria bacterium]|nr:FlgD immunoglobulin-like domain containing protein [Candidatus Krumholzibacteria bacterium]